MTIYPHIKKNKILNIRENFKTRKPVNQFIDDLIEDFETKLLESHVNVNIRSTLQQECECRQLWILAYVYGIPEFNFIVWKIVKNCLPHHLRTQFFRATHDCKLRHYNLCFIWGLAEKTSQRSIQPISWKCSSSRTANKAKPKFYRPSLQKKECILTWSAKKSNKLIKTKKGAIKIFAWTSTIWWSVPNLKRCQ